MRKIKDCWTNKLDNYGEPGTFWFYHRGNFFALCLGKRQIYFEDECINICDQGCQNYKRIKPDKDAKQKS